MPVVERLCGPLKEGACTLRGVGRLVQEVGIVFPNTRVLGAELLDNCLEQCLGFLFSRLVSR